MQRYNRPNRASSDDIDDELRLDQNENLEIEGGRSVDRFDVVLVILAIVVLAAMVFIAATH